MWLPEILRFRKVKRKPEKPYVIKDPKDFATDRVPMVMMGWVNDGSLMFKLRIPVFVFLLYTAPIHHIVPVFCDTEADTNELLMASAIEMLYVLLCPVWPVMIANSQTIRDLWKTVRKGFVQYSDPFTTEERTIMSRTNDNVVRSTKISIVAYFCAGFGTFFKEMSPESISQYKPPYPGWFPWTTNTFFRYLLSMLYQCSICINTTFALEGIFLLFAYHTIHFEGQLLLLKKHYQDTFPQGLPASVTHTREFKERTMMRLKECVRHHLIIKKFHKSILRYFGFCLLVYRVVCTIMLCMLAYLTTTDVALNKFLQLLCFAMALMFLCFIFCLKGEEVFQLGEMWRHTVYEVEWYNHPVEVQQTVRMMQIGASKSLPIYGVWKPAMFSHEGICVIAQETFSFFNMLRAMK